MDTDILSQVAERSWCGIVDLGVHDACDAFPVGVQDIGHLGRGDELGTLCRRLPNERRSVCDVALDLSAGAHLYEPGAKFLPVHAFSRSSARRPARLSS